MISIEMQSPEYTLSDTALAVRREMGRDFQTQLRLAVDLEQIKLAPVFPTVLHSYIVQVNFRTG
jgi:hypothetical protein